MCRDKCEICGYVDPKDIVKGQRGTVRFRPAGVRNGRVFGEDLCEVCFLDPDNTLCLFRPGDPFNILTYMIRYMKFMDYAYWDPQIENEKIPQASLQKKTVFRRFNHGKKNQNQTANVVR